MPLNAQRPLTRSHGNTIGLTTELLLLLLLLLLLHRAIQVSNQPAVPAARVSFQQHFGFCLPVLPVSCADFQLRAARPGAQLDIGFVNYLSRFHVRALRRF
jgi:hypothetical protein